MRRFAVSLLLAVCFAVPAQAVPFWGAKESSPADTPPAALKPGEFVWAPGIAPEGPITVVVSLTEQRAYVYRNGVAIGYTTVSTGKPGHETPTGIFTILQKDKNHRSSKYNNAPMPYQQRLTWDGVALHAGGLPGYPESHGCVHLPSKFAEDLFAASHMGMTVVVVDATGEVDMEARLQAEEKWRWEPEKSPEGPVSIMLSAADQRVIVIRNGIEIGRSRAMVSEPGRALGTHAFIIKAGEGQGDSAILKGAVARNWMAVPMPGYGDTGTDLSHVVGGRVHMPQDFARQLYPLLTPGTTLLVTDAPVLEENSGTQMTVMGSGNPNAPTG